MALWRRLEAVHLNGLSVALGVAATHLLIGAVFGEAAGLAAVGGAGERRSSGMGARCALYSGYSASRKVGPLVSNTQTA